MYYIIKAGLLAQTPVFQSEFLDDIEEWFDKNDPHRSTYDVEFESLED